MKPSYEELEVMLQDALDKIKASQEQEPARDEPCVESDGCPTEVAVLQRAWRELQRENAELRSKTCEDCDGDGWNYNAVEGQVPCVCMTEAEPYQKLEAENAELRKLLESKVPEVTDEMALAFHRALTDGSIGSGEVEEIKTGLRAAMLNAAPQPKEPKQ